MMVKVVKVYLLVIDPQTWHEQKNKLKTAGFINNQNHQSVFRNFEKVITTAN